jgi:hypothetical protein
MVEKDNSKEEKNIKSDLSTNINLKPEFFSEIDKNNPYIENIKKKVDDEKGIERMGKYPTIDKYKNKIKSFLDGGNTKLDLSNTRIT